MTGDVADLITRTTKCSKKKTSNVLTFRLECDDRNGWVHIEVVFLIYVNNARFAPHMRARTALQTTFFPLMTIIMCVFIYWPKRGSSLKRITLSYQTKHDSWCNKQKKFYSQNLRIKYIRIAIKRNEEAKKNTRTDEICNNLCMFGFCVGKTAKCPRYDRIANWWHGYKWNNFEKKNVFGVDIWRQNWPNYYIFFISIFTIEHRVLCNISNSFKSYTNLYKKKFLANAWTMTHECKCVCFVVNLDDRFDYCNIWWNCKLNCIYFHNKPVHQMHCISNVRIFVVKRQEWTHSLRIRIVFGFSSFKISVNRVSMSNEERKSFDRLQLKRNVCWKA